jgi:hypothetical protein
MPFVGAEVKASFEQLKQTLSPTSSSLTIEETPIKTTA